MYFEHSYVSSRDFHMFPTQIMQTLYYPVCRCFANYFTKILRNRQVGALLSCIPFWTLKLLPSTNQIETFVIHSHECVQITKPFRLLYVQRVLLSSMIEETHRNAPVFFQEDRNIRCRHDNQTLSNRMRSVLRQLHVFETQPT